MRAHELAGLYLTLGVLALLLQQRLRSRSCDHSPQRAPGRALGESLSMMLLWPLLLPFEWGRTAGQGEDGLATLLDRARACPMGLLLPAPRAMEELSRRATALRASLLQVDRLEQGLTGTTGEAAPLQSLLKLRAKTEQELALLEEFLVRVRFYAELLILEELTPEPSIGAEIEALMASFTFLEEEARDAVFEHGAVAET